MNGVVKELNETVIGRDAAMTMIVERSNFFLVYGTILVQDSVE